MKKYPVLCHLPMCFMEMAKDAGPAETSDQRTPLTGGRTLTASRRWPSERNVVSYSIVQAEDMEAAETLLADHPHLAWSPDREAEVHEMAGGSG